MASGVSVLDSSSIHSNLARPDDLPPLDTSELNGSIHRASPPIQIPRSASYTYLPQSKDSIADGPPNFSFKRTYSSNALSTPPDDLEEQSSPDRTPQTSPKRGTSPVTEELRRRKSTKSLASPKITISKFTLSSDANGHKTSYESKTPAKQTRSGRIQGKSRAITGTISNFARKTWMPSRSPSPSAKDRVEHGAGDDGIEDNALTEGTLISSSSPQKQTDSRQSVEQNTRAQTPEDPRPVSSNGTLTPKKSKRPLSSLLKSSKSEKSAPHNPSTSSLHKSYSVERLPSLASSHSSSDRPPPLPRSFSSDRLQSIGLELPRKKDELWSAFRSLEGDFQKFQTKTIALKANVVRSSLLPFLRTYASHPSNKSLRAEDLDRRINVLNKWWAGLLETLSGRNNQSISGTDRPVLLEGMAGIMIRPEWRPPVSPFCPLQERIMQPPVKSRSTSSLDSSVSDFLAESVYHNIRNLFIQNLLSQIAFVVDKMSLRSAPASLVTFCGKAVAYAFFFCPGVANVLVRLWATPSDTLRRVLEESGIPRATNIEGMSESIISGFPPHLHSLGFTSFPLLVRSLRRKSPLPLAASHIAWDGPWIGRWAGRDSDLLFVFTKHFHILMSEFLPMDAGTKEQACAPGAVHVHAQILKVLDSTIHRQAGQSVADTSNGPSPITFDDVLAGADASATALPLPPTNVTRLMAENRLIMLLREFLSERCSDFDFARQRFAEAFGNILKAAVRKTSMFNHHACFTLCDFMEEASSIMVRYHQSTNSPQAFLDWPFWLDVCKKMGESQNSMTQVRLFSFVYSVWGIIAMDEERKTITCLSWLLSEECFERYFNHWCPMVRAYYMRLICWRVARFDGDATDIKFNIYQALSDRLKSVWSSFLYLREISEMENILPPSTAPCSPAPGRRLFIIRNDTQLAPSGFMSLEGLVPPVSSNQPTAYKRHASLESLSQLDSSHITYKESPSDHAHQETLSPGSGKKRWGLLRNIMPFGTTNNDRSNPPRDKDTLQASPTEAIQETSSSSTSAHNEKAADAGAPADRNTAKQAAIDTRGESLTAPAPYHRNYSFKFSLEWLSQPYEPAKDRRLYAPRLPMPAQMFLQSKRPEPYNIKPCRPKGPATQSSAYIGKALAEWALIVIECQNFFERRKAEGVPAIRWVETPTLGVEGFHFTTNAEDSPLIVQFGASSALELARAVELVAPYCSGVDLNCGCPQSWACQDGLGAQLMHEREKVAEMIQAVKQRCGPELCISAKIRIHKDLRRTIDFIHTTEAAGVSFLSVHGRTRSERTSVPVNLDAIKLIKETTSVPVVANGDVWSMDDVKRIHAYTGVDGVMAARGLLTNPALFACHSSTPWSAVERFLNHATRYSLPFKLVQHHLSEMTGSIFGKAERQAMLEQKDMIGLIDWFDDKREIARRH
ncbi:MAG: hypothetical protein M1827_007129 [Pycnora praestabilis]|nr:MAG: hypothetical protein M1827_007129 [Pycnora praestabilis]